MKQIRLLPIVIVAGLALLLLKSIGVMSGGGYVLTGATEAVAAGGGAKSAESGGAAALAMPVEPTMTDDAPTLEDEAPTLTLRPEGNDHAEAGAGADESGHGGEDAEAGHQTTSEHAEAGAEGIPDLSASGSEDEAEGDSYCPNDGNKSVVFTNPEGCGPPLSETGEAVPMVADEAGNPVPLTESDGSAGSAATVLERLAERRDELDAREAELEMRLALVDAAEKRIEERAAALEVLEARINAMVDEKRTLEEAQFTAVVAMYETMKPKDAAAIFNELDMSVLLRVARAVNPRKMAPIMAKMDPIKAKDLTSGLAVDQVEPTIDMSGEDLAALPQIVGQ